MIHLKNTRNLFLIWLTVIDWLGIDLTGAVSVNAPLFGHIYLLLEFPHSLGEQPALNVAFMLGFKEFEASDVFKEQLYRKKFCLDFLTYITFLDSSLVAGGLQEEHDLSDTLETRSLVGDCKREEACIVSLLQFRSNLEDTRDHYAML